MRKKTSELILNNIGVSAAPFRYADRGGRHWLIGTPGSSKLITREANYYYASSEGKRVKEAFWGCEGG